MDQSRGEGGRSTRGSCQLFGRKRMQARVGVALSLGRRERQSVYQD